MAIAESHGPTQMHSGSLAEKLQFIYLAKKYSTYRINILGRINFQVRVRVFELYTATSTTSPISD